MSAPFDFCVCLKETDLTLDWVTFQVREAGPLAIVTDRSKIVYVPLCRLHIALPFPPLPRQDTTSSLAVLYPSAVPTPVRPVLPNLPITLWVWSRHAFFLLDRGHGQNLYQTLYASVAARPDVAELTVEDPSEEFEDLRDVCDLRMMVRDIQASSAADGKGKGRETDHMEWKGKLEVGPEGADKLWLEAKRRELKIAPVRFFLPLVSRNRQT